MKDEDKKKEQLSNELRQARSRLETSESRRKKVEDALNTLTRSVEGYKSQLDEAHEKLRKAVEERKNLESALRESRKYVRMIQESPDIVYVLDSEGRFIFLEGPIERLTGYGAEDLMGKHFTAIIWPEDLDKARWRFNERRTGSRATKGYEVRLLTKKRRRRHFDVRYRAVELDAFGMWDKCVSAGDKAFRGTYGVARDITARVRLEGKARFLYDQLSREHGQRKVLSKLIIDMLEAERQKLAGELHDQIGQTLASLRMDLELLRDEMGEASATPQTRMKSAEEKAVQAIQRLRSIASGLKPVMLESMGLIASLDALCVETEEQKGIKVHFFSSGIPKVLDRAKELALFRIAQEALANVVKHARATEIHVNLIHKEGAISLSVEDDGEGFEMAGQRRSTLGLLLMEERAIHLGGKFSIESTKGRGTYVEAEIPVSQ
jgi:PAS domain S-box-containing protein